MMNTHNGYQGGFASDHPEMDNAERRKKKAPTMTAALEALSSVPLAEMDVLDIETSTGMIASVRASLFRWALGGDVDVADVEHATSCSSMVSLSLGLGMQHPCRSGARLLMS